MPSATRPHRPDRWLADACEIGAIGSRWTLVAFEYRDGQRGLRDVGGEHDAPGAVLLEHPVLLRGGQPPVQRQELDRVGPAGVLHPHAQVAAQGLLRVADLPLA